MKGWEKVLFLIVVISVGGLLVSSLLGLDKLAILMVIILLDILIILKKATEKINKWWAFTIIFLTMFLVGTILFVMFSYESPYKLGQFIGLLFWLLLADTIFIKGKKK
ncbi:MAG: hypothetical protein V1491_02050 [archaeon]